MLKRRVAIISGVPAFASILASTVVFGGAAPVLTFDQALDAVLRANPTIAAQRAKTEAARAQRTGAQFHFLPRLKLSASTERAGDPEVQTKTLQGTATVNLFRFGADVAGLHAADAELDSQVAALKDTELKAESEAVEALVDVVFKQRRLKILREKVESTRRYLEIAQARYKRGALPLQDVDKVTIDFDNAQAGFEDARSDLNSAQATLRKQMDATQSSAELSDDWPWRQRFVAPEIKLLLERKAAPEVHPELTSARLAMRAEEFRARQQYRSIFPSLDLSFSREQRDTDPGTRTNGWAGGVTLSMPLFDGLRDYTSYRVQRAEQDVAAAKLERIVRDIPLRQDLAQNNFRIAFESAAVREKTLASARRLLESGLERFRVGRGGVDELTLDQNRVVQAELLAAQGWQQVHLEYLRLAHAFGQSVAK